MNGRDVYIVQTGAGGAQVSYIFIFDRHIFIILLIIIIINTTLYHHYKKHCMRSSFYFSTVYFIIRKLIKLTRKSSKWPMSNNVQTTSTMLKSSNWSKCPGRLWLGSTACHDSHSQDQLGWYWSSVHQPIDLLYLLSISIDGTQILINGWPTLPCQSSSHQ